MGRLEALQAELQGRIAEANALREKLAEGQNLLAQMQLGIVETNGRIAERQMVEKEGGASEDPPAAVALEEATCP